MYKLLKTLLILGLFCITLPNIAYSAPNNNQPKVLLTSQQKQMIQAIKNLQQTIKDPDYIDFLHIFILSQDGWSNSNAPQPTGKYVNALVNILKNLNVNNISFDSGIGIYSVITNNGEEPVRYVIQIKSDRVMFINEFDNLGQDDLEVGGFSILWIFDLENGELKVKSLELAG